MGVDKRMYPTGKGGLYTKSGEITLDGSNPTVVATGLKKVKFATATIKSAVTPGDDPVTVTVDYTGNDGNLDIYAWGHNGVDPTLLASTDSATVVSWVAEGEA